MDIRVDGYRSTPENWLYAQKVSPRDLPALGPAEQEVAEKLGLSSEDYARSQLAGDLTRGELSKRAERVGVLVTSWLRRHGTPGHVREVWFKTFEGKFRVGVEVSGKTVFCLIDEDVIEALLEVGSPQAERQLERLLDANFGLSEEAKAS